VNEPQASQAVTQGEQAPAPGLSCYIHPSTELANVSHLWALLEAITAALKATPDHDLRLLANSIVAHIEGDGFPRLLHLAQLVALYEWRPDSHVSPSN
jgi:hypothetical protein